MTASGRPYVSEAYETAATGHARVVGILVAAYGLDTIQRLVDRHGGTGPVQGAGGGDGRHPHRRERRGEGTTFTLELPVVASMAPEASGRR